MVVVGSSTAAASVSASTTATSELAGNGNGAGELGKVGGSMGAFAIALGVVMLGHIL